MSRLNRAFIKAFEREQGANAATAVLDRTPHEVTSHTSPATTPPLDRPSLEQANVEQAVGATITRVDSPAQLCLPRIVADVSLPASFRLQEPYPSLSPNSAAELHSSGAIEAAESVDTTSVEPTAQTWTPPFVYDGPTDWRSIVSNNSSFGSISEAVSSPPASDPVQPQILPRDFLSSGDSFRLDPSHVTPTTVNQPAAVRAAAFEQLDPHSASEVWTPPHLDSLHESAVPPAAGTHGLNEPALQVDRFAWPSVCLTLLERADAPFAGLVEELFAGVRENRKLLAVSGYRRGAGRTTFLLSAARALAARGARVLVADADWDAPHLAERLGVSPEVGWQDVLNGGLPLEETLIESLIDGVTLLPARPNRSRTRSINFALAQRNLEQLRAAYDFVLLDAGRLDDSSEGKIGSMLLEKMPIEGVLLVHDVSSSSLVNPSITERRLAQMQIRWWRVVENFARPGK